jgi:hypothetical protein
MTDPKEAKKPEIKIRQPKKATPGIFDNLRTPQPHPVEEILGLVQTATSTRPRGGSPSTPSRGSTGATPSTPAKPQSTVSPERDYTKVANSIVRLAVPSGIFGEQGGKAKELYDTLYHLTRGAVVPQRQIRISKDGLMRKAGIGSEVTLRKNLARLRAAKLIKESLMSGTHGGNEYEVFLPEEVGLNIPTPSTPSTPSNPLQDREGVEALDPRASTPRLSVCSETTSSEDKTLFLRPEKNFDDDEPAALALLAPIKAAMKAMTGRELSEADIQGFGKVGEIIAAEFRIAAARTTVNVPGAFLATHMQRRLFKKAEAELSAESPGNVASPSAGQLSPEEISKCPDCGGSCMWYPAGNNPEGWAKGAAKCDHNQLKKERGS